MLKLLIIFYACLFFAFQAYGQTSITDSSHNKGTITMVVGKYHYATDEQSKIFSGPEHIDYDARTVGVPYFESIVWLTGNIFYNGILYTNVPMKYDLVKDRVVIQHHNRFYKIDLVSEKVDSFFLAGHSFIRLDQSQNKSVPETGFYDVVSTGKLPLLIKRKKLLTEFIDGMEVKRRVDDKTSYFVVKDGTFYKIDNRNDLFEVLKDKRREVQQYLKTNKIKFRKNSENAFTAAIKYYNQLNL